MTTPAPDLGEIEAMAWRWRWAAIRGFVREAKFRGFQVQSYEGPGRFRRRFILIGSKEAIAAISKQMARL